MRVLLLLLLITPVLAQEYGYSRILASGGFRDEVCYSNYQGLGISIGDINPDFDIDCCDQAGYTWVGGGFENSIIIAVTSGWNYACALRSTGTVFCWGYNYDQQASPPSGLNNVIAVDAGTGHTCALKNDGTVVCWGSNNFGQSTPPPGLNNVIAISTGSVNNCALKNDGTVVCWGSNSYGQSTPPPGLNNIIAVAVSGRHSCALRNTGTVICWGLNVNGQRIPPQGLNNVTSISTGSEYTCALKNDGTVVCWGSNSFGQSNPPSGLNNAISISAGAEHTCALRNDGTVVCWGYNFYNQCNVPSGLNNVIAISAGSFYNCALKNSGEIVCWGWNSHGQLLNHAYANQQNCCGDNINEVWKVGSTYCCNNQVYNNPDLAQCACELDNNVWFGEGGIKNCCNGNDNFVVSGQGACVNGVWMPGKQCITASDCGTNSCSGLNYIQYSCNSNNMCSQTSSPVQGYCEVECTSTQPCTNLYADYGYVTNNYNVRWCIGNPTYCNRRRLNPTCINYKCYSDGQSSTTYSDVINLKLKVSGYYLSTYSTWNNIRLSCYAGFGGDCGYNDRLASGQNYIDCSKKNNCGAKISGNYGTGEGWCNYGYAVSSLSNTANNCEGCNGCQSLSYCTWYRRLVPSSQTFYSPYQTYYFWAPGNEYYRNCGGGSTSIVVLADVGNAW